ncbi:hypothetical protein GCM10023189_42900 [Nibrella saemangeumensis]|uniref:Uncharacterized protein n=1 Tax=Nibrella saemangeumensis TaxID=1084526 RepID=A0ABP8NDM6_9BACT
MNSTVIVNRKTTELLAKFRRVRGCLLNATQQSHKVDKAWLAECKQDKDLIEVELESAYGAQVGVYSFTGYVDLRKTNAEIIEDLKGFIRQARGESEHEFRKTLREALSDTLKSSQPEDRHRIIKGANQVFNTLFS